MTLHQTIFEKSGIRPMEKNLHPSNYAAFREMSKVVVDCPHCLHRGKMSTFAVFTRKLYRGFYRLARNRLQCPDCMEGTTIQTVLKITDMTVEEFGIWTWERVFKWNVWHSTSQGARDKFFARIKRWRYEDRDVFWAVYKVYKAESQGEDLGIGDSPFAETFKRMQSEYLI